MHRNEAAGIEKQGVAVGRFRALRISYLSGAKTELLMFLGDRISVRLSHEGAVATDEMITLMLGLDLEGIEALAIHPARR